MKARAKKTKAPRKTMAEIDNHGYLRPTCAQCGRPPSHPHYGGGLVGGVYCTWYCAMLVHRQTGCGIFVIDKKGGYVAVVPPGFSETPPSPSEVIEDERQDTQPTLELLLASGMRPNDGTNPPPKTTADMVKHIFGPRPLSPLGFAEGLATFVVAGITDRFLNGASKQ